MAFVFVFFCPLLFWAFAYGCKWRFPPPAPLLIPPFFRPLVVLIAVDLLFCQDPAFHSSVASLFRTFGLPNSGCALPLVGDFFSVPLVQRLSILQIFFRFPLLQSRDVYLTPNPAPPSLDFFFPPFLILSLCAYPF